MTYLISTHKKGISTCELARQFGVTQRTAWFFKRKIQQGIKTAHPHLLSGVVEVDETAIGGSEKGRQGRSHGKKKMVQVAIETAKNAKGKEIIKHGYATIIAGYDNLSLKEGLNEMVDAHSTVVTDKWHAYRKATTDYIHHAKLSDAGQNFVQLHWHIFNIKNWLRGTHHHVSDKHIQRYPDEYHCRFNNRNYKGTTTMILINRMINTPWLPYSKAIGN